MQARVFLYAKFVAFVTRVGSQDILGCFLGATQCCTLAGSNLRIGMEEEVSQCCARAIQDCTQPKGLLLLVANWPAALGNILLQLHDAVVLARATGRALLLPPVLGPSPAVDLEALAATFHIDILVVKSFSWIEWCGGEVPIIIFEVCGGARAGPYRDTQHEMSRGDMGLPHELIEEPTVRNDGILSYELHGTEEYAKAGKWWSTHFPEEPKLFHWELFFNEALQLPAECQDGGANDGAQVSLDTSTLTHEWVTDQIMKQHFCLAPLLTDPARLPASLKCLVIAQLFQAVHWGFHHKDHFRFFANLRFAPEVHDAADALIASHSTGYANLEAPRVRRASEPFIAMHIRTFFFEMTHGLEYNSSTVVSAFVEKLRRAVRHVRSTWPEMSPWLFIATENTNHPWIQSIISVAAAFQARGALRGAILTSDITRSYVSDALHRHVALDMLLCVLSSAFVGTSFSSLSGQIGALRQTQQQVANGLHKPWVSYWPQRAPCYADSRTFPTRPERPEPTELARFYAQAYDKVLNAKQLDRHSCVTSVFLDTPQPLYAELREAVFARSPPLQPHRVAVMWAHSQWRCPVLAIAAHLYWNVLHLNNSEERNIGWRPIAQHSAGLELEAWTSSRNQLEQARLVQRLWYMMWTGRISSWTEFASRHVRSIVLELLRQRIRLHKRCDSSEVSFGWDEAGVGSIVRSNRGVGDCLLTLEENGGLPTATIIVDVQEQDFLCPATLPSDAGWPSGLPHRKVIPPAVAIRLVPKAASTSALNWASELEGLRETYIDIVRLAQSAHADTAIMQVFQSGLDAASCTKPLRRQWTGHLVQFAPRLVGLPPQLCPSRCTGGGGRQKIAVVRNPFKRLTSWYSNWLGERVEGKDPMKSSMGDDFNSWNDFGRWLAKLGDWLERVRAQHCHEGAANVRDWAIWWHLLPMADMLSGRPACPSGDAHNRGARWNLQEYEFIRIENADADISALERKLCAKGMLEANVDGSCASLNRLRRHNEVAARAPPPSWSAIWSTEAIAHAVNIYSEDFDDFGYSRDPGNISSQGKAQAFA